MKKYIYLKVLCLLVLPLTLKAQIAIGNSQNLNNNSVLLDFESTNDRGLILPAVTQLPDEPVNGTLILDSTNPTDARVKLWQNDNWFDLSNNLTEDNGNVTEYLASRGNNNESNCNINPNNCKVILGADNSTADGVLVLESTDKLMVLPRVTSTDNIINPSPGMMAYVNSPNGKNLLAVFNGKVWSFWSHALPDITIDPW